MCDLLAQSIFSSRNLTGRMDGLERHFRKREVASSDPRLCAYSVFAIVCNEFDATSLLQVRRVVTSSSLQTCFTLALLSCQICCKLADLQSKIAATFLRTKIAIWV
ncbi:hypothetical protein AVEN_1556-1 [Araneus ventricosus]|uniref:Uncharacterized protein n=1 Tax=Araneus ventricosus TaxID=182803 RepID=A0A4Y2DQ88_ARAVE|nr:hypothetical protein AVEN_1556-1 [Araneus ventricosus]